MFGVDHTATESSGYGGELVAAEFGLFAGGRDTGKGRFHMPQGAAVAAHSIGDVQEHFPEDREVGTLQGNRDEPGQGLMDISIRDGALLWLDSTAP